MDMHTVHLYAHQCLRVDVYVMCHVQYHENLMNVKQYSGALLPGPVPSACSQLNFGRGLLISHTC